ncbi:MAG: cytochrome c3 family protein [Myxococcota bacterium]
MLLLLWWLVGVALADDPVVPAPSVHGPPGVSCEHCHADPHEGAVSGGCQRCHGTEAWVPAVFSVADHAQTKFPLEGRHQRVTCQLCHVDAKLVGLPTDCAGCHLDRHRGKLGDGCAECHDPSGFTPVKIAFDHAVRTGFALTGPHDGVDCAQCHRGANGDAMRLVATATCATCHTPSHATFTSGPGAVLACDGCHQPTVPTFAAATFDHRRQSTFPLERRHASQACAACHPPGAAMPDARCSSCHADPHNGQLGTGCDDCHRPDRWRVVRFDHDRTLFPLRGRHFTAPCLSCHTGQRWVGVPYHCWDCHAVDVRRAPASVPAHTAGLAWCDDCHTSLWSWRFTSP